MAKALVAYFSATGTTKHTAEALAAAIGADLFAIEPVEPYTAADLDWRDKTSRSTLEMRDDAARPAITHTVDNMDDYDVVFVGFPIWWYVEPRIIDTFLEAHDFAHKTVIPFATSGGSGLGKAPQRMNSLTPGASVANGKVLNGSLDTDGLRRWASGRSL